MERITKKADKKSRDVALEKNPQCLLSNEEKNPQCLLCLNTEVNESMKVLKGLTKNDLIKIIQNKNNLLVKYADWVEELKSEKERESK